MSSKTFCAAILCCATLSACDHMSRMEQRALSGAAIGAAGGLAVTALTGGAPLVAGAVIGAAGGAALGALTTPKR